MKKSLLFLTCLLFFLRVSHAQLDFYKVDSLRRAIVAANPSEYPWLFSLMLNDSRSLPPEQAINEAEETMRIAKQLSAEIVMVYAYQNLAEAYIHDGKRAEALASLRKAYNLCAVNNWEREKGVISLAIGNFYLDEEFLTEALEKFYEAEGIFHLLNDTLQLFKVSCRLAVINYRTQQYAESINDGQQAIQNFDLMKRPLRGDSVELMSTYNTMGLASFLMKDFDSGLRAFRQSEDLARRLNNEFWIALVNGNRSKIYRAQGFTSLAIQNLKRDLEISKKYKEWESAVNSAITLADVYLDENNPGQALNYLTIAESFHPLVRGTRVELNEAKVRARYYERKGDLTETLKAQRLVNVLADSIAKQNERINLGRFRARFELEKKQDEIAALRYSNELQEKEINNQRMIIWSAAIILILVALLITVTIRDSRKLKAQYNLISLQGREIENKNEELETQSQALQEQNQLISSINQKLEEKVTQRTAQLESTNQELDLFLYHASHDIRRPIATLLGLEQVFHLSAPDYWKTLFEKVSDTAHNMDSMLFKLQMAYELNRPTGEQSEVVLHDAIDEAAKVFEGEFQRNNVDYIHIRAQAISLTVNRSLLQVILRNLLENAVYFRKRYVDERHYVRISYSHRENEVWIEVEDNGIGIDPIYLDRIFDLYFRGTQQSKGNGLGLYLVKKAIIMLGGHIEVKSELGVGSAFCVRLPG